MCACDTSVANERLPQQSLREPCKQGAEKSKMRVKAAAAAGREEENSTKLYLKRFHRDGNQQRMSGVGVVQSETFQRRFPAGDIPLRVIPPDSVNHKVTASPWRHHSRRRPRAPERRPPLLGETPQDPDIPTSVCKRRVTPPCLCVGIKTRGSRSLREPLPDGPSEGRTAAAAGGSLAGKHPWKREKEGEARGSVPPAVHFVSAPLLFCPFITSL